MKNRFSSVSPSIIVGLITAGSLVTIIGLTKSANIHHEVLDWYQAPIIIFLVLMLTISIVGIWKGPRLAGIIVAAILAIALGATIPIVAVTFLALSTFVLGCIVLRTPNLSPIDSLLVGIAVGGTVLSLVVHLPVNNTGTWGLLFAFPLIVGWRNLRTLWPNCVSHTPIGVHQYLLHCAITAAALLHFLVGLMPELGNDALAMHLFVPSYISYHQAWSFNASTYVWAVMPMLVDWLFTAGYLFAGETGARLINVGSIFLLATLVHRISLWAGANKITANWATLLFLVTPLIYLESSSLFVEGMWGSFVIGGSFALLRLLTQTDNAKEEILLGSALLGAALAAKAITLALLPTFAFILLVGHRRWLSRNNISVVIIAFLTLLVIGSVPYITAFILTDNPVFPFFNAYFQSPLYPPQNFSAPQNFERGFSWDTLYKITFDSGRYLEASVGASGFQWLSLVVPGTLIVILTRQWRALLLVLLAFSWIWLTFEQTAYLRYIVPSFALACALIGVVLTSASNANQWAGRAVFIVAALTVALNLFYFNSATFYGKIDLHVITDSRVRDAYINKVTPLRSAVKLVNELNHKLTPVVFLSAPLTAGLKSDALYANWYNGSFQRAARTAAKEGTLGMMLTRRDVEYLVVDNTNKAFSDLAQKATKISTEIAHFGSVSIRKLNVFDPYVKELIPSINSSADWHLTPGAIRLQNQGLLVSVSSPAYIAVAVQPNEKYRYLAEARCATKPTKGRLQINWLRPDGKLARSDIQVFDCTAKTTTYTMVVRAPSDAQKALVYASAHGETPIIFEQVSLRH